MVRSIFKNKNFKYTLYLATFIMFLAIFIMQKAIRIEVPNFEGNLAHISNIDTNELLVTIKSGDTLGKLLGSVGVSPQEIHRISTSLNKKFDPSNLRQGDKIIIKPVVEDQKSGAISSPNPESITLVLNNKSVILELDTLKSKYNVSEVPMEYFTETKLVHGTIRGSLYNAAKKAGADRNVIMSFINLFSYTTDFQRDLQSGDSFKIFYEYKTDSHGKKIKDPKILYASLINRGKENEAYLFEKRNGIRDYFNSKGESLRRSLLSTPISGARITSGYGLRKHPVLGYSKMHRGLDYGAPKGTPILAAGDGIVSFAKKQNSGYGNHIKIKHNNKYSTLYAHMNKFAVKPGTRVSQGQVIGYVGASGMATGPHLHYEVIQDGRKVSPRKISFPKVPPLKGTELAKFKSNVVKCETMIAELESKQEKQVASINVRTGLNSL